MDLPLLFFYILSFALQLPYFQTKIAQTATTYLSNELGSEISLESVRIDFFHRAVIRDIHVSDLKNDTLLNAYELDLSLDPLALLDLKLKLKNICMVAPSISIDQDSISNAFNFDFLIDYFSPNTSDSTQNKIKFTLDHLEIINGRFRFNKESESRKDKGFDYNHLYVRDLNLNLSDLVLDSNSIDAYNCSLSFREKDLYVHGLGGDIAISEKLISINNFHYKSDYSQVYGNFTLETESWEDYQDFNNKVSFQARFLPSDVSMIDFSYFIPDLTGLKEIPHFSGNISGKINNIKGKDVTIALSDHSFADLDFKLKGLPNIENTYFYLNIKDLESSKKGLERIKIPPFDQNNYIQLPKNFASLGQIGFKGKLSGFLSDLALEGRIKTKIGEIETDIKLQNDDIFAYTGHVKAKKFDAGKFFDAENVLGKVTLTADIKGKGLEKNNIDATFDGTINSMEFNKYEYKNVVVAGHFQKERFQGNINVNDPFVKLNFIGSIDLSKNQKDFNFMAQVDNLYPRIVFGIEHLDSSAHISSTVNIDIEARSIDSLVGRLEMMSTQYADKDLELSSESFVFSSKRSGETKEMIVESDVFDFNLEGKYDLLDGFKTFRKLTHVYFPNLLEEEVELDKDFKYNLLIKDYSLIETFFTPGISFDSSTSASGSFRSKDNHLETEAKILGFSYGVLSVDSCAINLKTEEDQLTLKTIISHYSLGESDQERIIELFASAADNTIKGSLNSYGDGPFSTDLTFESYVFDHNTFDLSFLNSAFAVNDNKWVIPDSNYIKYDSSIWTFKHVAANHNRQRIALNGTLSPDPKQGLTLSLSKFDMSVLNPFVDSTKMNFEGILDGNAIVRDPYNDFLFESDMSFRDLAFNSKKLGTGKVKSDWDDINKQLNVNGSLKLNDLNKMTLSGYYNLNDKDSPLHFDLSLNELPLTVLEPFTADILSDFKGSGSGVFQLRGNPKDPQLSGLFYLKDAGLHVEYTNVDYVLKDKANQSTTIAVKFTKDSIIIPSFIALDPKGKQGEGSVFFVHNGFEKFDVNLNMNVSDFLILNTNSKHNELFFGQAYVSGDVSIFSQKGYSKIDMNVRTENNTRFNLPIDEASEITENKFIVFEQRESEKQKDNLEKEDKPLNIDLNIKLDATPGALIRIVFDEAAGDVIETRGSGDLLIKYDPKDELSMFGEYSIISGSYVFTLQTVVNKKFSIENGSKIRWKGDPYEGEMEIVTSYKTKARLFDILPEIDPEVNYKRRIPVDVQLKMSETIESPVVGFDVYLPDSKENVRGQLRTELSSESCLNQQVFSLLILGSFTPCESAQQSNANTNVGKNTAYEAMSNQLSGWLSQISDEVDIGFSYRPEYEGDEYSPEQVELAVSTQLLNDRVIVDYSGSSGNQTASNPNNGAWANEFKVEYKIREDGKLRVHAFHKVNDRSYIENDNLYIQGAGFKIAFEPGKLVPRYLRKEEEERLKKEKEEAKKEEGSTEESEEFEEEEGDN